MKRFSVYLDQNIQSWSQTLSLKWGKTPQRTRVSTNHDFHDTIDYERVHTWIKGCIILSRSNSNQYFNFHFMYGGFKKWVVDRYFVGSLYRNVFRMMWFPALVYYVYNYGYM